MSSAWSFRRSALARERLSRESAIARPQKRSDCVGCTSCRCSACRCSIFVDVIRVGLWQERARARRALQRNRHRAHALLPKRYECVGSSMRGREFCTRNIDCRVCPIAILRPPRSERPPPIIIPGHSLAEQRARLDVFFQQSNGASSSASNSERLNPSSSLLKQRPALRVGKMTSGPPTRH